MAKAKTKTKVQPRTKGRPSAEWLAKNLKEKLADRDPDAPTIDTRGGGTYSATDADAEVMANLAREQGGSLERTYSKTQLDEIAERKRAKEEIERQTQGQGQ